MERRGTFKTTNVLDNEIVKASDIGFAFRAGIDNIGKSMQMMVESDHDVIIGGSVIPGGGFNVKVEPLIGVSFANHIFFGDSEISDTIAINHESGGDACKYTLEVGSKEEEYAEEQRAFNDLQTGIVTYQNVYTRIQSVPVFRVLKGNSEIAPEHTEGFVKIAEIHIPANTVAEEFGEDMIMNITSDLPEEENEDWTNELDSTFNAGRFTDMRRVLRTEHNQDGTHAKDSIGAEALYTGIEEDCVNSSILPIGKSTTLDKNKIGANEITSVVILKICEKLNDLLDKYINKESDDAYYLNGEINISSLVRDGELVKPVILYADGEGNGGIKVGNTVVITFKENGIIEAPLLETAVTSKNDKSLVTRVVTNALAAQIDDMGKQIQALSEIILDNNYNTLLESFTLADVQPKYATTENIQDFIGIKTIDGIQISVGDILLVKDQIDPKENGIYVVQEGAWGRHELYSDNESMCGKIFIPTDGNTNSNRKFVLKNMTYVTDVDALVFFEPTIAEFADYAKYIKNIIANTTIEKVTKDSRFNLSSTKEITLTLGAALSLGLQVEIYNTSNIPQKIVTDGNTTWTIKAGDSLYLYWTVGGWSKYSMKLKSLEVESAVIPKIEGMIENPECYRLLVAKDADGNIGMTDWSIELEI